MLTALSKKILTCARYYSTITSKVSNVAISETRGMLLLPQLQSKIQDRQCTPTLFGRLVGMTYDAEYFCQYTLLKQAFYPKIDLTDIFDFLHKSIRPKDLADVPHDSLADVAVLEPDLATIRNWEWTSRTVMLLADALHGTKCANVGPRGILKRQLERLEKKGLVATIGAAIDFYLYSDSYSKILEKEYPYPYLAAERKQMMYTSEKQQLFINDILTASIRSGLQLTSIEAGKDEGQVSAQFSPSKPLAIADTLVVFKKAIHQMALDKDMSATFMAMPDSSKIPSELSLCISVKKAKDGADELVEESAKKLAQGFLASVPLFCPNPNSYKRLVSLKKEKVPLTGSGPDALISTEYKGDSFWININTAGADCCPYLAIASVISNLIDEDIVEENYKGKASYPLTMKTAIRQARKQPEVIEAVLGPTLAKKYLDDLKLEQCNYEKKITMYDRERYFA